MASRDLLPLLLLQLVVLAAVVVSQDPEAGAKVHEYCIVGAGPAGLQLGYFLRAAERDYVIIERAEVPGAFFETYPRHDTLISINKRNTDSHNTEYSLRHDWNSLLSNDPQMQMRHYSVKIFPKRQDLLLYLRDFRDRFKLNVHFRTNVTSLKKETDEQGSSKFLMDTSKGRYHCQVVIVATGFFKMRSLNITGIENTVSYDQMSLNPTDYEGKRVLIIGKGNTAFETAAHIYGRTRLIHLMSRRRIRLAWSTHYVGDVRAVNNELLDTYQLKSIDALIEHDANDMIVRRRPDGRFALGSKQAESNANTLQINEREADTQYSTRIFDKLAAENSSVFEVEGSDFLNYQYDTVIRANGFEFDQSWLPHSTTPDGKYPRIGPNYESSDQAGLYFAGTLTHSLDFRKAAGGFIHGFRYTARALHRILEVKRHAQKWPSVTQSLDTLMDTMLRRINEGSGTYQMFQNLGDVFIIDRFASNFTMLEEFPVRLLPDLPRVSGHQLAENGQQQLIFVFVFEYGRNFSGPALDVFNERRAGCDTSNGYECNFLHPVVYRYDSLPSEPASTASTGPSKLPEPAALLHLREDVHTNFRSRDGHVEPLAAFLEAALDRPLYPVSLERCALLALASGSVLAGGRLCSGWNSWSAEDMQL